MGYISELDTQDAHEGWVALTLEDGTLSSGTSTAAGFYLDGYTYLPADDNDIRTWGVIDPAFLRPYSDVAGWCPRCECGWIGVTHPLSEDRDYGTSREPDDFAEDLLMGQWRLHIRQTYAGPDHAAEHAPRLVRSCA